MATQKKRSTLRGSNGGGARGESNRANVASHLPQVFVIHRSVEVLFTGEWWVSEASTGFRVIRGQWGESETEVLRLAREKLAGVTPKRMKQILADARKQRAMAPRRVQAWARLCLVAGYGLAVTTRLTPVGQEPPSGLEDMNEWGTLDSVRWLSEPVKVGEPQDGQEGDE